MADNLKLDAFVAGRTLTAVGGAATTGLDRFVAGVLYPGIAGPTTPPNILTFQTGVFLQSATVPAQLTTQLQVGVFMQATTFSLALVDTQEQLGVFMGHTVTIPGYVNSEVYQVGVIMQCSTYKTVPGTMPPGGLSLLGVGL